MLDFIRPKVVVVLILLAMVCSAVYIAHQSDQSSQFCERANASDDTGYSSRVGSAIRDTETCMGAKTARR